MLASVLFRTVWLSASLKCEARAVCILITSCFLISSFLGCMLSPEVYFDEARSQFRDLEQPDVIAANPDSTRTRPRSGSPSSTRLVSEKLSSGQATQSWVSEGTNASGPVLHTYSDLGEMPWRGSGSAISGGTGSSYIGSYGAGSGIGISSYSTRSRNADGSPVFVRSYTRADGTPVREHWRSAPDGDPLNNWSTKGNKNPITGEIGTKDPYRMPNSSSPVPVAEYVQEDGTYVSPHFRTAPDGNSYNNWSTKGNANPYTGEKGTRNPPEQQPAPLTQRYNGLRSTTGELQSNRRTASSASSDVTESGFLFKGNVAYPTLPGSDVRDFTKPGLRIEGDTVYQTLPGMDIRDYSKPGVRVEGNAVIPTLPGTRIRDFTKPGLVVDGSSAHQTLPGTNFRDVSKSSVRLEGNTAYPTIAGTSIRDYSKPGSVLEKDTIFPTLPGTNLRDYSQPGYRIDGNIAYPTVPGTTIRDYSKPGWCSPQIPVLPFTDYSQPRPNSFDRAPDLSELNPGIRSSRSRAYRFENNVAYPTRPGTSSIRDFSAPRLRQEGNSLYSTLPGSNIRDFSGQNYLMDGGVAYPTLPGTTSIRDYSGSRLRREGSNLYPTIPGTNLRDFSASHGYRYDNW